MTRSLRLGLLAMLPMVMSDGADTWAYEGHYMVGLVAAEQLPEAMPAFFRAATDQLAWLNFEPDRWKDRRERAMDPAVYRATAPGHYINLEVVPDAAREASDRWTYLETLRELEGRTEAGFLPFVMLELTQRVRIGLRLWRQAGPDERVWLEERIINDAGILGHYVADAANPLHTTVHFNGWTGSNPHGYATDDETHERVEDLYVRTHIAADQVRAMVGPATVRPDLREAIWRFILESNARVELLYQLDRDARFDEHTSGEANEAFIVRQLAGGASMLRDLWWTAWVTSAPDD